MTSTDQTDFYIKAGQIYTQGVHPESDHSELEGWTYEVDTARPGTLDRKRLEAQGVRFLSKAGAEQLAVGSALKDRRRGMTRSRALDWCGNTLV